MQADCELEAEANYFYDRRLHLLALLLLDTGCRITEALGLRVSDVDWTTCSSCSTARDGNSDVIPFSFALRKALHRFVADFPLKPDSLLFATQVGVQVRRMTALRSIKLLCENLGFDPPACAGRPRFATE